MRRPLLILLLAALSPAVVGATAPPEPPLNLSAAVDGNSLTLTWQTPLSGSTPLGYLVEASLSPGGAIIAAFLVLDRSFVRSAVPNGVYYLRVRSGNAEGISAASNEVVVSVPGAGVCPSPPNAPTNLSANVQINLVTLTWAPPSEGCAPTGYVVQAGSAPGLSDLAVFNVGGATTLQVSAPAGAYFVRVIAVNAHGGSSGTSNELLVLVANLTGTWTGTSDYINAPFQFNLVQNGRFVSGQYQDRHDSGSAFGEITGNNVRLDVNFGDTGIRYEGAIETHNRIRGTLLVPVLGRTFTFEMTR
jgi:hypothetical protein